MCEFLRSFWNETVGALTYFWDICIKNKGKISAGFLILCLVFLIIWLAFWLIPDFLGTKKDPKDPQEEINAWFYFLSGAGTAALAVIAYIKIGDINKQNQASFLLYIDERWGSPEVLKAREIIHTLYRETQEKYKGKLEALPEKRECYQGTGDQNKVQDFVNQLYKKNQVPHDTPIKNKDDFIQAIMGVDILKISKNTKMTSNFIYLLNFLDFMDTISYLAKDDDELTKELDDLCGDSLIFNYNIFKPYILYKRQKHQQKRFYHNFEKLHDNLVELVKKLELGN